MVVYPAQLTVEEKNLKKRYAKLLEKRKQLRKMQEKAVTSLKATSAKPAGGETLNPKDAMAAAKKLLETGKLKLNKKLPAKRTGFKRVGETPSDVLLSYLSPNCFICCLSLQPPPPKKAALSSTHITDDTEQKKQLLKQKKKFDQISYQKNLYSSFVRPSAAGDMALERIPKRQEDYVEKTTEKSSGPVKVRTVYVDCPHHQTVTEDMLTRAFSRFGVVEKVEFRHLKSAFITFTKETCAAAAVREMNRGMIRGYDVTVKPAGEDNNFVELSAEAASNSWAVIAAGKDISAPKGPSKTHSHRKLTSYGDIDI